MSLPLKFNASNVLDHERLPDWEGFPGLDHTRSRPMDDIAGFYGEHKLRLYKIHEF